MSKKPGNPCARGLLATLIFLFNCVSGSVAPTNMLKKVDVKPKIHKLKLGGIKKTPISKENENKQTSNNRINIQTKKSSCELPKPLFHRPEFDQRSSNLITKVMLTSYDARIISAKEQVAFVSALKNLPLPQLSFTFVNNTHGPDSTGGFLNDKNGTTPGSDNNGTPRENISVQATFDIGSAVMGLATTLAEQQLVRVDNMIQYSELYFNVCKAIQTYCTNLRKLWDCRDQVADFKKDDDDMQSRYKVGSISGISALQSRERLSTAEAKLKEAEINLMIAEKKLRQYTPHITKGDLETLKSLAKVDFRYSKEDTESLKKIAKNNLPGVIRGHMRMRKARMSGANAAIKPFLPTVSIEATPRPSYPKWIAANQGSKDSNIGFKTSWTMGVQTMADMGSNVLEARKIALEAEKEIQQSITDLNSAIEKYEQSIRVVELCRSKVESCKVRLIQHEAMDQNEPEGHIEKRSKFKEDLYKAKSEFEEAKEKLSFAFLESMFLSGKLISSRNFSDQVTGYNKNFRPQSCEQSIKKSYKQVKCDKEEKDLKVAPSKNVSRTVIVPPAQKAQKINPNNQKRTIIVRPEQR
jgi:outer membrane protein TolC